MTLDIRQRNLNELLKLANCLSLKTLWWVVMTPLPVSTLRLRENVVCDPSISYKRMCQSFKKKKYHILVPTINPFHSYYLHNGSPYKSVATLVCTVPCQILPMWLWESISLLWNICLHCDNMTGLIKSSAKWPIVRKRIGGTSGQREGKSEGWT